MKKTQMPSREALRALYPVDPERERERARRIVSRLADTEKEKPIMKKKISAALVCACIFLAITCAAIALSTNVFGWFAEWYGAESGMGKLMTALDGKSAQQGGAQTVAPANEKYATVDFTVEQSYYDGESLFIAYSLTGAKAALDDTWLPTEEELKSLDFEEIGIMGVSTDERMEYAGSVWVLEDQDIQKTLRENHERDGKTGAIMYSSYLGDGAYWGDGEDDYINLSISDQYTREDGTIIGYQRFQTPLPDAVRGKDEITVRFTLYRSVQYIYCDGEKWYVGGPSADTRIKEALYVTLPRTAESAVKKYPFAAQFEDYSASGTVIVTALEVKLSATLTAKEGKWLIEPDDDLDPNTDYFRGYWIYAGEEELDSYWGEFGEKMDGSEVIVEITCTLPSAPTDTLRLVPIFDRVGSNDLIVREEEAISVRIE